MISATYSTFYQFCLFLSLISFSVLLILSFIGRMKWLDMFSIVLQQPQKTVLFSFCCQSIRCLPECKENLKTYNKTMLLKQIFYPSQVSSFPSSFPFSFSLENKEPSQEKGMEILLSRNSLIQPYTNPNTAARIRFLPVQQISAQNIFSLHALIVCTERLDLFPLSVPHYWKNDKKIFMYLQRQRNIITLTFRVCYCACISLYCHWYPSYSSWALCANVFHIFLSLIFVLIFQVNTWLLNIK